MSTAPNGLPFKPHRNGFPLNSFENLKNIVPSALVVFNNFERLIFKTFTQYMELQNALQIMLRK